MVTTKHSPRNITIPRRCAPETEPCLTTPYRVFDALTHLRRFSTMWLLYIPCKYEARNRGLLVSPNHSLESFDAGGTVFYRVVCAPYRVFDALTQLRRFSTVWLLYIPCKYEARNRGLLVLPNHSLESFDASGTVFYRVVC